MDDRILLDTSTRTKKSLRQALRNILFKSRRGTHQDLTGTIGSGILRRDPSLCALPTPKPSAPASWIDERSDVADEPVVLDGFSADDLVDGVDEFTSNGLVDGFDISSLASVVSIGHSLKPQLSMSSFRTSRSPVIQPSPIPQRSGFYQQQQPRLDSLYHGGIGSYASLVSLPRRVSSLRIQRSGQSLRSEHQTIVETPRRSLMRKRTSIADVVQRPLPQRSIDERSSGSRSTNSSVRFAELPLSTHTPSLRSETSKDRQISHFSSFCILDTARPQCPVSATSEDLRYIFDIGEEFCLNNRGCEGTSMDMVTGWDASGNPITHLVLFSPLVIPSSGRSRFMLASLVDVTDFINDTASLPGLTTISEESSAEEDIPTPTSRSRLHSNLRTPSKGLTYALSAEDLLGGCFISEPKTPLNTFDDDDIWLNIATEEKKRSTGFRTPSISSTISSSIDDVLSDFMSNLQELYSDFFMLAKSPFDDDYYEICNVSPRVYAGKDYIHGHLSRTSTSNMEELSARLAEDKPFTMLVRWGYHGVLKQLYCIPLFARISTTWACFLVDSSLPPLWS